MSGRRSHPRFAVASPCDGALRVLRDVAIDRTAVDELSAVCHVPAVVGEEMSLDLLGAGDRLQCRVRVVESRPVVVDGSVRHRLRLAVISRVRALGASLEAAVMPNALPGEAAAKAV